MKPQTQTLTKSKDVGKRPLDRLVRRIGPKRYEIIGLEHHCGGRILIERNGSGQWLYEAYCEQCKTCDPNGHPTLSVTVTEARCYFAPNEKGQTRPAGGVNMKSGADPAPVCTDWLGHDYEQIPIH